MPDDSTPLYAQIRQALIDRIAGGEFGAGACIPSEVALAEESGVSPGTVRKAIDALVAEGVLTRHQGKGTFIAEQTPERAQYRFFRLTDATGNRVTPETVEERISPAKVTAPVARKLGLAPGDPVFLTERRRLIDGQPALLETIVTSATLMPGLDRETPLPNALYPFYQARYGLSVISTDDHLSAVIASGKDAEALGKSDRTALLVIERVARDLQGKPLEWRRTRCISQHHAWAVSLR
ncbi:MAG: GntR family transcriptional regulator [Pseudomonadota bacterium]